MVVVIWWYVRGDDTESTLSYVSTLRQWPKNNVIQVEGILYYPCGGHPGPQYVLLSGQVVLGLDPLQVGQKAKTQQVSVSPVLSGHNNNKQRGGSEQGKKARNL